MASRETEESEDKSSNIKAGQELKSITEWTEMQDELDELMKIFFEFLKRWTDKDKNDFDPNRPITYKVPSGAGAFKLDESPDLLTVLRDEDEQESKDTEALS